jgi:hypothetical protein
VVDLNCMDGTIKARIRASLLSAVSTACAVVTGARGISVLSWTLSCFTSMAVGSCFADREQTAGAFANA